MVPMSRTLAPVDEHILGDRKRRRSARIVLVLLLPTVLAGGFLYVASDHRGPLRHLR